LELKDSLVLLCKIQNLNFKIQKPFIPGFCAILKSIFISVALHYTKRKNQIVNDRYLREQNAIARSAAPAVGCPYPYEEASYA
jgi:hypothetical protein